MNAERRSRNRSSDSRWDAGSPGTAHRTPHWPEQIRRPIRPGTRPALGYAAPFAPWTKLPSASPRSTGPRTSLAWTIQACTRGATNLAKECSRSVSAARSRPGASMRGRPAQLKMAVRESRRDDAGEEDRAQLPQRPHPRRDLSSHARLDPRRAARDRRARPRTRSIEHRRSWRNAAGAQAAYEPRQIPSLPNTALAITRRWSTPLAVRGSD